MVISLTELLDNFVKNRDNRQLLTIPLSVLALSLVVLLSSFVNSGSPMILGMEFEGGTQISLETNDSPAELEKKYSSYPIKDARQAGSRVIIEFGVMGNEQQGQLEKDVTSHYSNVQIQQIGPVYGKDLQVQALKAIAISFVGMTIVVFLLFRTFVPSFAVIFAAFSDIVIAVAFMRVAGVELSLGTLAALLMLIGYSVDSDILLTNRVLKRRGTVAEKVSKAMHNRGYHDHYNSCGSYSHVYSFNFLLLSHPFIHADYFVITDLNRVDCWTFCRHDKYLAIQHCNSALVRIEARIQREI